VENRGYRYPSHSISDERYETWFRFQLTSPRRRGLECFRRRYGGLLEEVYGGGWRWLLENRVEPGREKFSLTRLAEELYPRGDSTPDYPASGVAAQFGLWWEARDRVTAVDAWWGEGSAPRYCSDPSEPRDLFGSYNSATSNPWVEALVDPGWRRRWDGLRLRQLQRPVLLNHALWPRDEEDEYL